jgi:iron only hydrogenase large subunit-like protein
MIKIYYPELLKYLAPVDTPAIAHAKMIKDANPDAKVIFIGPCIAKKLEAKESEVIDGVLTFDELVEILNEKNIDFYLVAPYTILSWIYFSSDTSFMPVYPNLFGICVTGYSKTWSF